MAMNNAQILNNLTNQETAFKSLTNMVDGKAILSPENLGRFLREASLNQTILSQSTFEIMNSPKKRLNRTGIAGRALTNGYDADGKTRALTTSEKQSLKFGANELDAKKLKACATIEDDQLEDNIEGESLKNTLLDLMGERIGEDLEFWGLFADSELDLEEYEDNSDELRAAELLVTADGWIKKAAYETKEGTDFEISNLDDTEKMFDVMIKKLSPRFRQRDKLKFFVPFEVEDAYRNLLKARGTALGDSSQIGFAPLKYKNISIENATTLDDPDARSILEAGVSLLGNPQNNAWGLRKNVSIEPKRIVELETTEYWFRFRGDIDYYFRNGAVTSSIGTELIDTLPNLDIKTRVAVNDSTTSGE